MISKELCPIPDKNYQDLEKKVGKEGAFRLWMKYFKITNNNDAATKKALELFDIDNFSVEQKIILIENAHNGVDKVSKPVNGEMKDVYVKTGTSREFERTTEFLNQDPRTMYRHTTGERVFADTGTNFHDIFQRAGQGDTDENITEAMQNLGIPEKLLPIARKFFQDRIDKYGGHILVEKRISSERSNLAGQVDVIHIKADGTYDILDFKTTYLTEKKKANNQNPWDPVKFDNGYKANRYTTQLTVYGRILEEIIGHGPQNKLIIPIIVELNDDDSVADFQILPEENVDDEYGFTRDAEDIVNDKFDQKIVSDITPKTADTSTEFIEKLTGRPVDIKFDASKAAAKVPRNKLDTAYFNGRGYIPFKKNATEPEKIDQIVREHINTRLASSRSFTSSISNYITTGESKFLDNLGPEGENLKTLFKQYIGRKNIDVIDLATVEGFGSKKGWFVVQDGANYDLYFITQDSLKGKIRNSNKTEGLFGEWYNDAAHLSHLRTNLKNVYGDAKVFEAVLTAMKIKQSSPNATFGTVSLYSISDSATYENVAIEHHLPTVKALWDNPKTKGELPKDMIDVFSDKKYFKGSTYAQDYIKLYSKMAEDEVFQANTWIKQGVDAYTGDIKSKKRLSDLLAKELVRAIKMQDINNVDMQTRLIAEMYFQINNITRNATGVRGFWEKWGSARQNQSDPVLQAVYQKANQSLARLQTTFWDYKLTFGKVYDSLVKDSNQIVGIARDYTLGDTARYFAPLFKKQEVDFMNADGKVSKRTITLFEFKDEGSPEFNALTEVQQKAIKTLNDEMQKIVKLTGIDWKRGNLPIVKSDFYNQLYNARTSSGQEGYRRAINKIMENIGSIFETSETKNMGDLGNMFESQTNETSRRNFMGMNEDGTVVGSTYNDLSTNLEIMMDSFMIQGVKFSAFKDLAATIKGAKILNIWKKHNLLDKSLDLQNEYLDDSFSILVHTKDPDAESPASKPVRVLGKAVSFFSLGYKPSTAFISYAGQELGLASKAMANAIVNVAGYRPSHVVKAHSIVYGALGKSVVSTKDYHKIASLMVRFRLFNQDSASYTNGYHRVSDKTIMSSKFAYSLMNGFDWMARAEIMIAQMLQDGTWDAYQAEQNADGDWEVTYDERKDQRFKELDAKKATALKNAILEQQLIDQTGDGVTLSDAYDTRYTTKMKAEANEIAGAMSHEDRNNANFVIGGRFFSFYKSWLSVKIDRYVSKPQTSDILGNMIFEEDENGEVTAIWKGDQMEGIFYTFMYGLSNLSGIIKGELPLTKRQKLNIYHFTADMIIAGTVYAIAKAFGEAGGGDDDDLTEYSQKILLGAVADLTWWLDMIRLDEFYYTPVALTSLKATINNIINIMGGAFDPDDQTTKRIYDSLAFSKQVGQINTLLGFNEED